MRRPGPPPPVRLTGPCRVPTQANRLGSCSRFSRPTSATRRAAGLAALLAFPGRPPAGGELVGVELIEGARPLLGLCGASPLPQGPNRRHPRRRGLVPDDLCEDRGHLVVSHRVWGAFLCAELSGGCLDRGSPARDLPRPRDTGRAMSQENVEIVRRGIEEFRAGLARGDPGAVFNSGVLAPDATPLKPSKPPGCGSRGSLI